MSLARSLAAAGDEASLRAAVSRAYYAAYNEAVERGLAIGLDPLPKRDARGCMQGYHKACWQAYKDDRFLRQVGLDGERLSYVRVAADYSLETRDWVTEASDAIDQAATIRSQI